MLASGPLATGWPPAHARGHVRCQAPGELARADGGAQVVADGVSVPGVARQDALHAAGMGIASMLGQLPAVLALHVGAEATNRAAHLQRSTSTHLAAHVFHTFRSFVLKRNPSLP